MYLDLYGIVARSSRPTFRSQLGLLIRELFSMLCIQYSMHGTTSLVYRDHSIEAAASTSLAIVFGQIVSCVLWLLHVLPSGANSQEEYASYGPIGGSGVQTFFDEFKKLPANIFRRMCTISSTGIFLNLRWPPRLTNIITSPQILGLETQFLALYPGFDARRIYWMGYYCDLTFL